MRAVFILCAVACLVLVTLASPAKDLKEAKKEAAQKKGCSRNCANEEYKPVCAGKQGSKPISFGSACVMNQYNCERDANEAVTKISDGECPGGQGVRLS